MTEELVKQAVVLASGEGHRLLVGVVNVDSAMGTVRYFSGLLQGSLILLHGNRLG